MGLIAKKFGTVNMAMLFGVVMLAHQIGGFFGAFLGGYVFQATGSYDWVWYIDIVLAVGAALVPGGRSLYAQMGGSGASLDAALTYSHLGADPAMLKAGTLYLRTVGPLYGFFGVGLVLYFASQGAGRMLWPVAGNIVRLAVAAIGGWLAIRCGGGLAQVFMAQAAALAVYGSVVAAAIAGGAWFGRVGWPCRTSSLLKRLPPANLNPTCIERTA